MQSFQSKTIKHKNMFDPIAFGGGYYLEGGCVFKWNCPHQTWRMPVFYPPDPPFAFVGYG